eukprot:IDg5889t1
MSAEECNREANYTTESNFKPEDGVALATCWLAISQRTIEQNAERIWKKVHVEFMRLQNTFSPYSTASLKYRLTTVQQVPQKYVAADKLYCFVGYDLALHGAEVIIVLRAGVAPEGTSAWHSPFVRFSAVSVHRVRCCAWEVAYAWNLVIKKMVNEAVK